MVLRGRSRGASGDDADGAPRRRRRARSRRGQGRGAEAVAAGAVPVQGQHRPDRDQRVRRLRRADRRQRRARADRELAVLQEPRLQGEADGQRGRELVGAERRQDRRRRSRRSTCSPPTAGSCTPSCRRRSGSRAAPTASSCAATSSASTSSKGKTIATAQFTEVDFFIRYLAQEAGLAINTLGSLDATPHPDRLNLVYTEDGFGAGDLFLERVKSGKNRLAGCVTWEPKVSEVVDGSGGQAHVLTTNRNLLIIADVLIVHRGFAEEQPKIVEGLVQGLLEGNRMVRDRPDSAPRRRRPRVQVDARRHEGGAGARCTCRTCRRTSRSSPARSTRPAASAASTSRRCSPTAAI